MFYLEIEEILISRIGDILSEGTRYKYLYELQKTYPSLDSAEICATLRGSLDPLDPDLLRKQNIVDLLKSSKHPKYIADGVVRLYLNAPALLARQDILDLLKSSKDPKNIADGDEYAWAMADGLVRLHEEDSNLLKIPDILALLKKLYIP